MTPAAEPGLAARSIHGLRLEQYAGVCAALTSGFSLEDALANDALEERKWRRAAPAWAARLARQQPDAPLKTAFDGKLSEAEAWLGRRVEPIEDDVESWVRFLRAWSSDADPDALLSRLKVGSKDVSRIQKRWSATMEKDDALRRRVMKLAAEKPAGLPSLRVVPAKLRPFPWSDTAEIEAPAATGAEVSLPPADEPSPAVVVVKPSFLLSSAAFSVPAPSFMKAVSSPAAGLTPVLPAASPAVSAARPAIGETVLVFELPKKPLLPFVPPGAAPPVVSGAPAAMPKSASPAMGETLGVFELPKAPVMPFSRAAPRSPAPEAPRAASARANWLSAPIGETLGVFELPVRPALPFGAAPARGDSASASAPQSAGAPRGGLSAAPIGETVVAFELPKSMVLPFAKPAAAPAPVAAPAPAAAPAPVPAAPASAAAPPLTLEQHASLSAELAMFPARSAEILRVYRVSPESKRQIDRHYADLGAARPEVQATWDRAYRTYYQWLLTQPRLRG